MSSEHTAGPGSSPGVREGIVSGGPAARCAEGLRPSGQVLFNPPGLRPCPATFQFSSHRILARGSAVRCAEGLLTSGRSSLVFRGSALSGDISIPIPILYC